MGWSGGRHFVTYVGCLGLSTLSLVAPFRVGGLSSLAGHVGSTLVGLGLGSREPLLFGSEIGLWVRALLHCWAGPSAGVRGWPFVIHDRAFPTAAT